MCIFNYRHPIFTFSAIIIEDTSHVLDKMLPTPTGPEVNIADVVDCMFDGKGGGSSVKKFLFFHPRVELN